MGRSLSFLSQNLQISERVRSPPTAHVIQASINNLLKKIDGKFYFNSFQYILRDRALMSKLNSPLDG